MVVCGICYGIGPNFWRNHWRGQRFERCIYCKRALGERATLQLRAEAFNVFNHPNFLVPTFTLDNANVGRVTETAGEARELQFAIKLLL